MIRIKLTTALHLTVSALVFSLNSFGQSQTFNFTGSQQSWVVPTCVTSINVTAAGADGGGNNGGNGAVVTGSIAVTPGQTIYIYVGGSGACPGAGWNGGGVGQNANSTANRSCGGGGASDIRIGGTALGNRVIVAAGGGGMGGGTEDAVGGVGGCATGTAGTSPFGQGGGGATQSAGGGAGPPWISSGNPGTAGTLGQGGNGGTDPCYNNSPGGGGGGGYYGGGGGGSDCFDLSPYGGGSGGGGSSLTPGGGGCNAGTNNGAGYITITWTVSSPTVTPSNTGPYCVGATIQLNAGGTGTTYAWTGPNGFTSSAQNPTLPATTAAAGTYNVTVSNGSCSASGSTTVVINPSPTIAPNNTGPYCAGTTIQLNAGGTGTTYSWTGPGGFTSGLQNPTRPATVANGGTYNLTVTSAGCSSTASTTVVVNPLPTIAPSNTGPYCAGTTIQLNAGGTGTTYSWTGPNGFTSAIQNPTLTATTTAAGTYNLTVSSAGCSSSGSTSVVVNSAPVIAPSNTGPYCAGTTIQLNAGGTGTTYAWTGPNGFSSATQNPTLAATSAASGTYNLTVTTAGCSSTLSTAVTVNPIPLVNGGPDQTLCQGSQATLTATGATTYVWTGGVTNGVAFTPPAGSTSYTVTGTSLGCSATDQVNITVNPTPPVNAGADQTVCAGTQVTLTGTGATTYAWNNGVTQGVPFTPGVGTTVYTVTGTSASCVSTDQVSVTVNPIPTVNAGLDQTVCAGSSVTLTGSGATSYTWSNGIAQGVAFIPVTGSTTYTVTGTSLGCSSTDQVVVNVNPLPLVNAGIDQSVCTGTSVTLNASGAASYSWNNGVVQGVAFIPAVGIQNYTVTGTSLGCSSTDQVVVTVHALPNVSAGPDLFICSGQNATLLASGASSYNWTPGGFNGASYTVSPVSNTNYTVTGTDLNGCTNSDAAMVSINPTPIVDAGNAVSICQGGNIALNATGQGNFTWTNGILDGQNFTPQQSAWYYVTANLNGCTNMDSVYVTVEPVAPPTFTALPAVGCVPLQVQFENTTANASNCQWTINGVGTQNCGVFNQTFTNPGYYNVQLTTTLANGCVSSINMPNMIYAAPIPVADFNYSPGQLDLNNTSVQFLNQSQNANSYVWDFGNGSSSTAYNPTYTYPWEVGSYDVELIATSSYGCVDTVVRTITVNDVLIYYVPNTFTPDGDLYNQEFKPIFTSGFDPYDYSLLIFNRWGEILFESHNAEVGWDGTYGGSKDVADGTYTYTIEFKTSASDERKKISGHLNLIR